MDPTMSPTIAPSMIVLHQCNVYKNSFPRVLACPQFADIRFQILATIQHLGHDAVLGPRHVAQLFRFEVHGDRVSIVRIGWLAPQRQGRPCEQRWPGGFALVKLKSGNRRFLDHDRATVGNDNRSGCDSADGAEQSSKERSSIHGCWHVAPPCST